MPEFVVPTPATCYPGLKSIIKNWVSLCRIPKMVYDAELQAHIQEWGFPWFRAGAVVYNAQRQILMMHESRVQVRKIKDKALKNKYLTDGKTLNEWVDGDGGWNLPSGRLILAGESFESAAMRRVKDECGWEANFEKLLLLRHSEDSDNQYIMPVYLAKAISGPTQYKVWGTSEIGWFTVEEIWRMKLANQLRSPEFVIQSVDAFLCQKVI